MPKQKKMIEHIFILYNCQFWYTTTNLAVYDPTQPILHMQLHVIPYAEKRAAVHFDQLIGLQKHCTTSCNCTTWSGKTWRKHLLEIECLSLGRMIIFERCCQCGDAQGEHNMSFNQLTQISQNKHIGSLNPFHFGEECMIAKELTSNLSAAAPSRQEALQWGFGKTLPITGSCPVWNPANGPPWLLCVILIIIVIIVIH